MPVRATADHGGRCGISRAHGSLRRHRRVTGWIKANFAQRVGHALTTIAGTRDSQQRSHSLVAAPVGAGDAARHLQGGANRSGVSMSPYNSQSGTTRNAQQVVDETGTTIDAGQIAVVSRQGDIITQGAQLTAQGDLSVLASQGAIHLGTGEASQAWQSYQRGHQFGDLGGNGYAGTQGERQERHDQSGTQTSQSTLRTGLTSEEGDVMVIAHGDLSGQGVDIAGRDVTLVGRNVTLTPSADTAAQQQHDRMRQAGMTVALSGVAAQAAQAADAAVAAHDRGDDRLAALYAAEAAYGAKDAANTAGAIDYGRAAQSATGHAKTAAPNPNGDTSLVKVTVSIGSSHQSGSTSYQQQTQQGSTITASRDVALVATGDGTQGADGYAANGDITLQGAHIQAGRDASLAAARDISLTAGQDTTQRDSQSHSGSASVGVGFALGGQQNGFTIELAAAAAKGQGNGDSTTNHATTVHAGDTLSLTSGRDTTLEGAQAYGNTLLADIGRHLSLTSTQDTDHYQETYQSASAGLSLCIPPICYGATSGGASYSQGNLSNQYQSVTDQTGLAAGSGGFDIRVGGTTTLTGAALASTADPSKNVLDTGSLVVDTLHNSAHSSASQTGFSFSGSGSISSNLAGNATGAALNLAIPQGGSHSSDTESRIAQGTIVVRDHPDQDLSSIDRSATTLDGNGVSNDFDVDKVKEKQEIGQAAGYVGMRAAGDLAKSMADHATTEQEQKAWSDGGANKVLLHGLVGAATAALGGGDAAQGALGAAASEAASGAMTSYLANHGIDPNSAEGKTLMQLASAAVGGAVGGGAGAATALDGEKYNRQLHPNEIKILDDHAEEFAKKLYGDNPTPDQIREANSRLLAQANRDVNGHNDGLMDAAAESYINKLTAQYGGQILPGGQHYFYAIGDDYFNDALYAETLNTPGLKEAYQYQIANSHEGKPYAYPNEEQFHKTLAEQNALTDATNASAALQVGVVLCGASDGVLCASFLAGVSGNALYEGAKQIKDGHSTGWVAVVGGALGLAGSGLTIRDYAAAADAQVSAEAAANQLARASYSEFGPQGIVATDKIMSTKVGKSLIDDIRSGSQDLTLDEATEIARGYIESGSTFPMAAKAAENTTLYKMVPKGQTISDKSGYWMTESQLRSLSGKSPDEVAKILGLPARQAYEMAENGVDVYSIVPKPGENPEVFVSKVAKTSQGSVNTPGGATQVIVPNRQIWSAPEKQGTKEFVDNRASNSNTGESGNRSVGAELSSLNSKTGSDDSDGAQGCGARAKGKAGAAQACADNKN